MDYSSRNQFYGIFVLVGASNKFPNFSINISLAIIALYIFGFQRGQVLGLDFILVSHSRIPIFAWAYYLACSILMELSKKLRICSVVFAIDVPQDLVCNHWC